MKTLTSFFAMILITILVISFITPRRNTFNSFPSSRIVIDSSKPNPCDQFVFLKNSEALGQFPKNLDSKDDAIFWISPSADPGENVLLKGSFSDSIKSVEISMINSSIKNTSQFTKVSFSQVNNTGLVFAIPKSFSKQPYTVKVTNQINKVMLTEINQPVIIWTLGIDSFFVTSGKVSLLDTLHIFGRNLPVSGSLIFSSSSARYMFSLPFKSTNGREISLKIGSQVKSGNYAISVLTDFNFRSNQIPLTIAPISDLETTYIDCSGLIGDGKTDNSLVLQHYLDQSKSKNRTIFNLPSGTFYFSKPIHILSHQYLRGRGRSATELQFKASNDLETPNSWLWGADNFGVYDLTIDAPVRQCIVSNFTGVYTMNADSISLRGNVIIENSTIRCSNHNDSFGPKALTTSLVQLFGKNIRIINSELNNLQRTSVLQLPNYTDNIAMIIAPIDGAVVTGNDFKLGNMGNGLYLRSYKNVLVKNNKFTGIQESPGAICGMSLWSTRQLGGCKNLFVSQNNFQNIVARDKETITSDGGGGNYLGHVAKSSKTITVLTNSPSWVGSTTGFMPNSSVAVIVSGTGLGEVNWVSSADASAISFDSPWTVAPDTSSIISIYVAHENMQIVNNQLETAGHLQFYGSVINSEISENRMSNSIGIHLYSGLYNCACVALENIAVNSNVMVGTVMFDSLNQPHGIDIRTTDRGSISGIDIRRNVISSTSSAISFTGKTGQMYPALIENNQTQKFKINRKNDLNDLDSLKGIKIMNSRSVVQ